MEKIKKFIKNLTLPTCGIILGVFLILDSARIMINMLDASKMFSALFGIGLIIYTLLQQLLNAKNKFLAKALKSLFFIFLLSFVIIEGLLISGAFRKAKEGDAVIILGAALWGENPSPVLRFRLNTAYDFLMAHPEAICVVSGGQGADEVISEAQAMTNYLVEKGLPRERIIMEDKATNTIENFEKSKVLLDEYFKGESYQTVYVTNTFHVYRSGMIAERAGLTAQGLAAPNLFTLELNYFLREYCSLVVFWLFR